MTKTMRNWTLMDWVDSYRNHILHSSFFAGIAAYTLKSASRNFAALSSSSAVSTTKNNNNNSSSIWSSTVFGLLSLAVSGLASFCLYMEIDFAFKRIGLPPGDSGYPLVGHLLNYIQYPQSFLCHRVRSKKYSGEKCPITMNMLMNPLIWFMDDEDILWAMAQERKGNLIPSMPDFIISVLGRESVIFQHSADHRRLRRVFEPSFSPMAIQGYLETIDETTTVELEKWCARDDFCSSKEWALLAMRLFFVCAFGRVEEDLLERLSSLFHTWINGIMTVIPFAIPGTALHRSHAAGKELGRILQKLIDDFKSDNPPGSPGAENSMMGRLCYGVDDDGNKLTDSQLTSNVQFILFAGHDTTKGSFGSFAHYLAWQPKLRALLVEEVNGFSEPLDIQELKAAPLLNAFMAETWRLVPPADAHGTKAVVDLEYKGYKIRKGVSVAADITAHSVMNSDRYPDPLEFKVERWLPKEHPMHDPKYYQESVDYNVMSVKYRIFNMGQHMCLGAHFAKLEARVVLTRLLQKYDIEIRNDELTTGPLLQYSNDFKLTKRS